MGFGKNTTASLREGFGTINGTLVWLEVLSCTIAGIVVLAFFFAPYRRWHTNPVLKLLFWASAEPVGVMLSNTLGVMQGIPYRNELYLVWAVLLLIAYGSSGTTSGYSLYTSSKQRMAFEAIQFLNNCSVAVLIAFFPGYSKFKVPLWALWCLIMVKWIQRILSFRVASRRYGTENMNLVADYMSYEHELTNHNEVDPTDMKGYKYLVVGEDKAKTETRALDYLLRLDITDKKVITIDKVWQCQGRLLRSGGNLARHLKDVCLSFSLFKLLRRRFVNYSAAEACAALTKTHDFVFRGLLMEEEDYKRAFRVIKVELEFLYDLFYTKYPISFSRGFSFFYVLQIFVIMLSIWTAVRALHDYRTPETDINRFVDGKINVDAIISHVFVVLIMFMEVWEFCKYLFSDWATVMLTCNYVKHPELQDIFCLDKLLCIIYICCGKLWRPLDDKIGQYSLLENFRYTNFNIPYYVTFGFMADKKGKGVRKQGAVKLSKKVKEAIFLSLKMSEGQLSNGESSLRRNGVSAELLWASRLPSHTHTIMVWHIATSHFEMIEPHDNVDHHRKVATRLSRYCAYLLVFAPELLPVSSCAVKYMFEKIVAETRTYFKDCKSKDSICQKMTDTNDPAETIIKMGAKLVNQLVIHVEDGRRWRVLAEFWAELMLFLAPSDNATAHAEKLGTGREFITHLWALLYHAGIIERPQSSHVDTVTDFSV